MNDKIDRQTFEETTRYEPSPDIKNIMVTGGNGFMCVSFCIYESRISPSPCIFPPCKQTRRVREADLDFTEVLGLSELLPSPMKTVTTSSPSTS